MRHHTVLFLLLSRILLFSAPTRSESLSVYPTVAKFADLKELSLSHLEKLPPGPEKDHLLGQKLLFGAGVNQDISKAIVHLTEASMRGHPGAQSMLGFAHKWGIGVPRDDALSTLYHRFASKGGHHVSTLALGYSYIRNPETMCEAASYYFQVASDVNYIRVKQPGSLPMVDPVLLGGRGPGHYEKENPDARRAQTGEADNTIQFIKYLAERGQNIEAIRKLGQLYYFGARGMPRDLPRAADLFHRAAGRGDVPAMAILGEMYAKGIGVTQSGNSSLEYYKRAADSGNIQALNGLGYLYAYGMGVPQNYTAAREYFLRAAERGDTDGAFNVGVIALEGHTGEKNITEALHYFHIAARSFSTAAAFQLGKMYLKGEGLAVDCAAAARLLRHVAEQGPWGAMLRWGLEEYLGSRRTSALLLYLRASDLGYDAAHYNAAWLLSAARPGAFRAVMAGPKGKEAWGVFQGGGRAPWEALVELYRRGAELGSTTAALRLADAYFTGRGTLSGPDPRRAASLYRQLASLLSDPHRAAAQAQFALAAMHETGRGLPLDWNLAKSFYDKVLETDKGASAVPVALARLRMDAARWLGQGHRLLRVLYPGVELAGFIPGFSPHGMAEEALAKITIPPQLTGEPPSQASSGAVADSAAGTEEGSQGAGARRRWSSPALGRLQHVWWEDLLLVGLVGALGVVLWVMRSRRARDSTPREAREDDGVQGEGI